MFWRIDSFSTQLENDPNASWSYIASNHSPHLTAAYCSYFLFRRRLRLCRQCPSKPQSLCKKWRTLSLSLISRRQFGQSYLTTSSSISSSIQTFQHKSNGHAQVEPSSPSHPARSGVHYASTAQKSRAMSWLFRVRSPRTTQMVLCTSFWRVLTGTTTHGNTYLQATALVEPSFIDLMELKDMLVPSK